MKLVTVHFNYAPYEGVFDRLINVFLKTAKHYMPDLPIEVIKVDPPDERPGVKKNHVGNNLKLQLQVDALKRSEGEVILTDCDLMFLGDIRDAFEHDFDIAYTIRKQGHIPFNGGVIFVRVNERSIAFFEEMLSINNEMYKDVLGVFHRKWKNKYKGLNQAAFGYMLERYEGDVKLLALPFIYNSVNDTWPFALEKGAKVIHIKSRLRKHCLGEKYWDRRYEKLWELWQEWEQK